MVCGGVSGIESRTPHGLEPSTCSGSSWLLPHTWVANGALSLDGERFVLGGLGRRVTVVAEDDHCVLRLPGKHVTVVATAAAPAEAFVELAGLTEGVAWMASAGVRVGVVAGGGAACGVRDVGARILRPGPFRRGSFLR